MSYVKVDKDAKAALDKLTDEIDKQTKEAIALAEKHHLKLDLISGTYIPMSLDGEGIDEEDIPDGQYDDYDYVNTEYSGWVGSAYHC